MAKLLKNVLLSAETVVLDNIAIKANVEVHVQAHTPELAIKEQMDSAYQQGYLSARAEHAQETEQEINQLQQQLAALIQAIPTAIAHNRLALNKDIADIVALITKNYFISQAEQPAALEQQINHILEQINSQQRIELYLHSQDIKQLKSGAINLTAHHINGLKIKQDDSLLLGGCIVKTEHGLFDASIEKQIDKLKELLIGIRQGGLYASTIE